MRKSDNVEIPGFTEDMPFIGKGIECQVFEIVKEKLVCKIYDTDNDAKYCYTLQRIAYRAGIGPEPMGLENNYYFSRYIESCQNMKNSPRCLGDSFEDFLDKVQEIFGGRWSDNHSGNIGVNGQKNGKICWIIIDFGIAGFISTNLGRLLATKLNLDYG